jgi:hypothetical protein
VAFRRGCGTRVSKSAVLRAGRGFAFVSRGMMWRRTTYMVVSPTPSPLLGEIPHSVGFMESITCHNPFGMNGLWLNISTHSTLLRATPIRVERERKRARAVQFSLELGSGYMPPYGAASILCRRFPGPLAWVIRRRTSYSSPRLDRLSRPWLPNNRAAG